MLQPLNSNSSYLIDEEEEKVPDFNVLMTKNYMTKAKFLKDASVPA